MTVKTVELASDRAWMGSWVQYFDECTATINILKNLVSFVLWVMDWVLDSLLSSSAERKGLFTPNLSFVDFFCFIFMCEHSVHNRAANRTLRVGRHDTSET